MELKGSLYFRRLKKFYATNFLIRKISLYNGLLVISSDIILQFVDLLDRSVVFTQPSVFLYEKEGGERHTKLRIILSVS